MTPMYCAHGHTLARIVQHHRTEVSGVSREKGTYLFEVIKGKVKLRSLGHFRSSQAGQLGSESALLTARPYWSGQPNKRPDPFRSRACTISPSEFPWRSRLIHNASVGDRVPIASSEVIPFYQIRLQRHTRKNPGRVIGSYAVQRKMESGLVRTEEVTG